MIINFSKYQTYKLPLNTKFVNSKTTILERDICIIQLSNDKTTSVGECSPYPNINKETFQEVLVELDKIINLFPIEIDYLNSELYNNFIVKIKYPSLACAFEQALLNLFIKSEKFSLDEIKLLRYDSINLPPLIGTENLDDIYSFSKKYYDNGFRTVKIKVGINPFREEVTTLIKIVESCPEIKLRIDANGKLKFPFVFDYLDAIKDLPIEYIEQPMKCLDDIIYVQKFSPVPVAADEVLNNYDDILFAIDSNIKILILKPNLLGGFFKTLDIIQLAQKKELSIIISSVFESNIGYQIPLLLSFFATNKFPQGIHTFPFFQSNLISNYFTPEEKSINFTSLNFNELYDFKL